MPPRCSLCASPRRDEIDAALVEGRDSFRNIAERFGTSPQTLIRHRAHVPERLALARRDAEVRSAETLAEKLRRLEEDLRRLLGKAEGDGDFRAAIAAVKTALDLTELAHKVSEEREGSVLESPEWDALADVLLEALRPIPGALEAAGRALEAFADRSGPHTPTRRTLSRERTSRRTKGDL